MPACGGLPEFDTAESIGMGLRIPVTDEDAQAGFDRIVVLGLKASWDARPQPSNWRNCSMRTITPVALPS